MLRNFLVPALAGMPDRYTFITFCPLHCFLIIICYLVQFSDSAGKLHIFVSENFQVFFDHVTLSNINFVLLLSAVAFMNISQHFEMCNFFYSNVGVTWSQISADSHLLPLPGILSIFCCQLAILLHPLIFYIFTCFDTVLVFIFLFFTKCLVLIKYYIVSTHFD
jgi:hypothetical protein